MKFCSRPEQGTNVLDFCVDFSKNGLSRFFDKYSENQQNLTSLSIDELNSLIECGKKLKDELQTNLESYKKAYIPKLEKLNQEKKQVNNQKLKKQTINPPSNPVPPAATKDKNPPRIQHETTPIINTLPPPPPPKIEKHSSNQAGSQTRHHDKKNVSKSTGGDKPVKPSNKNSVWYKADPFFQKLPSNEEFNKVFSIIDTFVENRKIQANENTNNEKVVHWSERMNQYVRSRKMYLVPPPPPDVNDISDYWKSNQISFQIEDMQKRSFSCFHHLINSFIELDGPLPKPILNSPISSPNQNEEIATKDNDDLFLNRRDPNPIASFSLLPQIKSETYMALSFDQRLSLEIESLELNPPNGTNFKRISPIEEEINTKIKESNEIVSTLSKMRDDVMSNIDTYRRDLQKRNEMIEESQKLIAKKNKQSNKQ